MTNRPTYAPERRPGEATDPETAARELVAFHFALADVKTIAAMIFAGAAALEHADALNVGIVSMLTVRHHVELARLVADTLLTEGQHARDRIEEHHAELERQRKADERDARKKAKALDPLRAMAGLTT
jgi:hypothetical protein